MQKRKCPVCGKRFYPIVPVQKYCKGSHRVIAWQRRHPDRIKAYRDKRKESPQ
jgi:hypothetical protein